MKPEAQLRSALLLLLLGLRYDALFCHAAPERVSARFGLRISELSG